MDAFKKFINLFLLTVVLTACGGGDTEALKQNIEQNKLNIQSIYFQSNFTQTYEPANTVNTTQTLFFPHNTNDEQLTVFGINGDGKTINLNETDFNFAFDFTIINKSNSDSTSTIDSNGYLSLEQLAATNTTEELTIQASFGDLRAFANITSSSHPLQSGGLLVYRNDAPVIAKENVTVCDELELTARGQFTDGSTRSITQKIDWPTTIAESDKINAKFDSADLFKPLFSSHTHGLYTLTVTYDSEIEPVNLQVTQGDFTSMVINPTIKTLQVNNTQQLNVTAVINGVQKTNLESIAKWTTADASIADVNTQTGVVTGKAVGGPIEIKAECGTTIASSQITVNVLKLTSIEIRNGSAVTEQVDFSLTAGNSKTTTLTLFAHYSDGSEDNISNVTNITWSATVIDNGAPDSITVDNKGVVTANSAGIARISSEYKGQKDSLNVTVTVQN